MEKNKHLLNRILEIDKEILGTHAVSECEKEIKAMVNSISHLLSPQSEPQVRINVINNLIFKQKGFPVPSGTTHDLDMKNRLVTNAIINNKGYCVELAIIYLIISKELSLPIKAVAIPISHMFLRYEQDNNPLNIELSYGGEIVSDDIYFRIFRFPYPVSDKSKYLVPLTDKEVIGVYLNIIGHTYFRQKQYKFALQYFERELELTPKFPKVHYSLGYTYLKVGNKEKAIEEFKKEIEINPNYIYPYLYLSKLHTQKGESDKALPNIKVIIKYFERNRAKGYTSTNYVTERIPEG